MHTGYLDNCQLTQRTGAVVLAYKVWKIHPLYAEVITTTLDHSVKSSWQERGCRVFKHMQLLRALFLAVAYVSCK